MRIALIGAVRSTEATLVRLLAHGMDVVAVFGYRAPDVSRVSGYVDLEPVARSAGVEFWPFRSINEPSTVDRIRACDADVLFVVGLSQLVGRDVLSCARRGAVGYHPTALPEGRGRAPIAWLVLERRAGASTFFELTLSADDGAVFVQEPFSVDEEDDATRVEAKVLQSLEVALDRWLPQLKKGEWRSEPQREDAATYFGRRSPEDGVIDWRASADDIDRLVKASSRPHPGAFTYRAQEKVLVWRSRVERSLRIRGVRGRILSVSPDGAALVQAGDGLIWLLEYGNAGSGSMAPLRVGEKLGYDTDIELHEIMCRLRKLEEKGH
jgi:methionyl-tRNA formyltransferase